MIFTITSSTNLTFGQTVWICTSMASFTTAKALSCASILLAVWVCFCLPPCLLFTLITALQAALPFACFEYQQPSNYQQ